MSSRMFQGVLLQLSEAAQTTIGVIDAEGNVISCSDTTLIGEKWPDAATAVAAMLENPVREEPYTFYALKGWNPAYGYSAFVLGTDAQAEMLVRMTQVSLNSAKAYYEEKHDKGTFVKNIITDNILPGDIYIRAKELHFPTELPRAVYLVRQVGRSDVAVVELLQSMYPDTQQDFVINVNETDIALVRPARRKSLRLQISEFLFGEPFRPVWMARTAEADAPHRHQLLYLPDPFVCDRPVPR